MIAVDTSALICFFNGDNASDMKVMAVALADSRVVLPPVVLTEVLSDPQAKRTMYSALKDMLLLDVYEGFWHRSAITRQKILGLKLKAKLADTLIAQSCIDHDVPLITRDKDFRHYAKHCGLKLYA
jgi:predicted nucleic acid-binding protein